MSRCISLILHSVSLTLLYWGLYTDFDAGLRIAVFLYWISTAVNAMAAVLMVASICLLASLNTWNTEMEASYQKLFVKSLPSFIQVWAIRLLSAFAVTLLILHDYMWLPILHALSLIAFLIVLGLYMGLAATARKRAKDNE